MSGYQDDHAHTTRRNVLMGGALGAGALLSASGLSASARAATQAGAAAPAAGPDLYFLKIGGITDNVTTSDKYKGYIQLSDFTFGASHPVNATGTGAGSGAAHEAALHFDSPPSLASPLLFLATASGKSYPAADGFVVDASNGAQFIKYGFTNVAISSYQFTGGIDGNPIERGSLLFQKCHFAFYPVNADGALGTPTKMNWNFSAR